jgi:hypothetical protein
MMEKGNTGKWLKKTNGNNCKWCKRPIAMVENAYGNTGPVVISNGAKGQW